MSIKMLAGLVLIISTLSVYTNGAPEEVPLTRDGIDENDIPEECRNQNFCTIKPADYPQEKFNAMIDSNTLEPASLVQSDLDVRAGDPEELDNCETLVRYEPLYRVRTKLGDWRVVIQAPEKNYLQRVRTEICKNSQQACFAIFLIPDYFSTSCVQKFTTWQFVVESKQAGKFDKLRVDLPTCCSCHYRNI